MSYIKKNTHIKKILIVGFGSIGKRHIEIVRSLFPDITIGLLRHRICRDKEVELYGIKHCFTSAERALEFQPDAAIISNPASKHINIAMLLAGAGIHLLIEKPISNNKDGVQDLINLCSRNKVTLMTAYNLRFLPSLNEFRNLLHQGKIGVPYTAHIEAGQYLPDWRPGSDYRQIVSAQEKLGGGVLLELSHEIDYMQWIFGSVEWVNATLSHQSHLEIDVEDVAYLQVGIKGRDNNKSLIVTLNIDFIRHNPTRQCCVVGENGSLLWNGLKGSIEYFPQNGKKWENIYSNLTDKNYTYEEEIKHFISSANSGSPPYVRGEDGLKVISVIELAKESNSKKTLVCTE